MFLKCLGGVDGGHTEKPAAVWTACGTQELKTNQAEVKKGQQESCCSQCLSVSNHADRNHTTPSAQQKISLSIYPYNITIQASGHLLSLSKQKSSLETLVMQVMAWNHPFSRKKVILHLESEEDWLAVQNYYVSQIQSPLVIQKQLTDQSLSGFIQCRYVSHWTVPGFFLGSCWHRRSVYCCLLSLWKALEKLQTGEIKCEWPGKEMQTHNTGSLCCELKWGGENVVFLGKVRSLLLEYDGQLPFFVFWIWCRVTDVPSLWCAGCLSCFLIPVVCGQTQQLKGGGSCIPCLGSACMALGRLWRMQVGKQTQLSPGRQICVRESFPRHRNLCGFLSVCSINSHSSHWEEC